MPDTHTEQIRAVLRGHSGIRQAILFGSVAEGGATSGSDLDLAVSGGAPLDPEEKRALITDLAHAIGRPVDLIDLETVGEPLLGRILSQGKRLLGDDTQYARILLRHLYAQADFAPYRERILRERRKAWIGH